MKVIFSDMDGVVNNHPAGRYRLRSPNVKHLNTIVRQTDAVVVVSSYWRFLGLKLLRRDFKHAGFKGQIVGRTPTYGDRGWGFRELEIQSVIRVLGDRLDGMVILDDKNYYTELEPWLVQTNGYVGLTADAVEPAVAILNSPPPQPLTRSLEDAIQEAEYQALIHDFETDRQLLLRAG